MSVLVTTSIVKVESNAGMMAAEHEAIEKSFRIHLDTFALTLEKSLLAQGLIVKVSHD